MRYSAFFAAAATLFCVTPAWAAPWDKPGWALTFHDEFDTGSVDSSKWTKRYKWGEAVINQELQAYIDDAFAFDGDVLRIVGKRETGTYAGQSMEYTSGVLSSVHEQTYGYFEIRCRMPAGQGLWPAFWLLGANGTQGVNEIDIHEFLGHDPDTMYMTIHWGPSYDQGHESSGDQYDGADFTQDFHTFAVDWDADRVIWYVDDVERFQYTGPGVPQVDMYVITNLAIGGGWPGAPDGTTTFPAYYDVDYIRVYERADEVDAGVDDADAADPSPDAALADGPVNDSANDAPDAADPPPDAALADGPVNDSANAPDTDGAVPGSDASSSPGQFRSEEADGCACRWAPRSASAPAAMGLLSALVALGAARRRRRN